MSSNLGGQIAAVQTFASATATAVGGLQAKWGVKVQTMGDGTLAAAGIELMSGAPGQSTFAVLADKFLVYKPDGSGPPKPILELGTVQGTTQLGIHGALIVDGTIVGRNISGATISAVHMGTNSITAQNGAIADATVETLKIAGNAVTVPSYLFNGNSIYGNGTFREAGVVHFYMDQPGAVFIMVSMAQFYTSPDGRVRETYALIELDGSIRVTTGGWGAFNMSPTLCYGTSVSAGLHGVRLMVYGADSTVYTGAHSIILFGVKR
jgi:hypothetical protein